VNAREVVRVLVVEDDPSLSEVLLDELRSAGHDTQGATLVGEAVERLRSGDFDVVLLDLMLPDGRGTEVLRHVAEERLATECIVLTGYAELSTAIEAMKLGAYDYLSKPVRLDEVDQLIRKAAEKARLRSENEALRLRLERLNKASGIVTEDPAMKAVLATLDKVAQTDLPVLVQGESGTGKELAARAVHERSPRFAQPFVALNCAAVPEGLLESELFGHERGAFTGALMRKPGLFELAHRGTLFLDEVAEVSPALQAKLLRAVETGEIQRVGGTRPLRLDVRIVAATNRDLRKEVREGRFREDFYFRLNGVTLRLPPLRERPRDVALLAAHFLAAASAGRKSLSPAAIRKLESYTWPGNVRELQMVVKRAAVLARGEVIEAAELPIDLTTSGWRGAFRTGLTLAELEQEYIKTVLNEHGGHRGRTARALGIDAKTLYNKLGPERPRAKAAEPVEAGRQS
jgi:DNA-binding NtrC family response regulator